MNVDDLWISYAKTIVHVMPPGEPVLRISPAPRGEVGEWPHTFKAPMYVITAWNPASERLVESANRERQEALDAELRQLTLELWPAVGLDPDSSYREEGVAVSGLTKEQAITLGARHGQNAIFAWTPTAWRTLSCIDERRHEAGWRLGRKIAT